MTETSNAPAAADDKLLDGYRVVQRTIIRPEQELDIRPLYISGVSSYSAGESTSRQSGAEEPDTAEKSSRDGSGASKDSYEDHVEAMGAFGRIAAEDWQLEIDEHAHQVGVWSG